MDKKPGLIRTIYFYFFSGLGLVLLIVGTFNLSQFVVKKTLLPKYDLGYEETRCTIYAPQVEGQKTAPLEAKKQKDECLKQLNEQRQAKQVLDLTSATTLIVVGAIVFVFHFRRTKTLEG